MLYAVAVRIDPPDQAAIDAMRAMLELPPDRLHFVRTLPLVEWCERCRRRIVVGYAVDVDVWRAVAGETESLCTACFDESARDLRVRYIFTRIEAFAWHDAIDTI